MWPSATVDSWLSLMSGAILVIDEAQTIHYCNQTAADWLESPISSISGSPLHDFVKGIDIARGGRQTVYLNETDYTPFCARIETRNDLQGILIELKSWEQEVNDERLPWSVWNNSIQLVQRTLVELAHCENEHQLYYLAILLGNKILDIDRSAIFLFDQERRVMNGTWGTSESGDVVDERYFHESVSRASWSAITMNNRDFVASWEDFVLRHDHANVGVGWYAATGLFDTDGHVLGWFVCDNLINGGTLQVLTRAMIGIYAAGVANAICRLREKQALPDVALTQFESTNRAPHLALNREHALGFQSYLNQPALPNDLQHLFSKSSQTQKNNLHQLVEAALERLNEPCRELQLFVLNQIPRHFVWLADEQQLTWLIEQLFQLVFQQAQLSAMAEIYVSVEHGNLLIQGEGSLELSDAALGWQCAQPFNGVAPLQLMAGIIDNLVSFHNHHTGFVLKLMSNTQ